MIWKKALKFVITYDEEIKDMHGCKRIENKITFRLIPRIGRIGITQKEYFSEHKKLFTNQSC